MADGVEVRPLPLPARIARLVRRDGPLMAIDLGIVLVMYLVALALRFEGDVPKTFWVSYWRFAVLIAVIHLTTNKVLGLYGRMWQFASVHEAQRVVLAGTIGTIGALTVALFGGDLIHLLPLSVAVLGSILSFIGFSSVRFQARLFAVRRRPQGERHRTIVIGAGEAGAMLVRDILRHPEIGIDPVALVDDDVRTWGRKVHGVNVEGGRGSIPSLATNFGVDQALLAVPSATSEFVRDVAALCEQTGITLKVLPSLHEIVGGRVSARDIRDLRVEDLLGRRQVDIDLTQVAKMIQGRRVMVTGGGGSIGSEIARQVAEFAPSELVLVDHDETLLHDTAIHVEDAELVLGDVRDGSRMTAILNEKKPDIVLHAAALKHVPLLEEHAAEAFSTNVLGTINAAEAAADAGVKRFVLISTDKAVKPSSVMGISKRLAEQALWTIPPGDMVCCAVRFGNVLGSRGSVVPTFFKQIAQGGPVTVTDPEMTRYFMSIGEAVRLVLQAAAIAHGGEVFTLDMGEPVKILELAERLVRLSGKVPSKDISIQISGRRPGEKLYEDVVDEAEEPMPSEHPAIVISRHNPPDARGFRAEIDEILELSSRGDSGSVAQRMSALCAELERIPIEPRRSRLLGA